MGRVAIRRRRIATFAALLAAGLLFQLIPTNVRGAATPFTFGAAGDFGQDSNASSTLTRLAASGSSFFLALGDLSYTTDPETVWCSFVTSRVGTNYPFELISGNHESSGLNGLIDNFAKCLPDRLRGLTGIYAKEYYFDYPKPDPLARFILVSPGLTFTNGGTYSYSVGSPHYTWLSSAIDDARAKNIPWVIVGMHKVCISIGTQGCEIGQDVVDLLTTKKVDLVLQGHDHTYQRSKQLSCAKANSFVSSCVVNDDSTNLYSKGVGTVFVIAGTGGHSLFPISTSDSEAPYFTQKVMGYSTAGFGYGFVKYTVSTDRIDVQTSFSGTFSDLFQIAASGTPPLSADFTFSPAKPVVGETVSFTATASRGTAPYAFSWTFGDASTANGATVSHAYARTGSFSVSLKASDSAGRVVTVTKSIEVAAALSADFTFSPTKPTVGQTVSFSASTSGGTSPYSYGWTFGDGSSGSGQTVSHVYSATGTFTVTLKASDSAGHSVTVTKSIVVSAALTASFTFSPTKPVIGESIAFSATASDGTAPYTYSWSFGDGSNGAGATVSHAYASAGTFTVTLTASDSASHTATVTKSIVVTPPLTTDFSSSPTKPVVGETISFSASASGGTSPYSYSWTFGDGSSGSGPTVSHAYSATGTFTVTLTVSDSVAHTATATRSVAVSPPLVVSFTFTPTQPVARETVSFTGSATGGTSPYSYGWDFGDGGTDIGATVSHIFASAGSYKVTFTASDSAGHSLAVAKSVDVTPPLTADISFAPTKPMTLEGISLSGVASGGTAPYVIVWDFGDGSSGSGPTVSHAYSTAGTFTVTLTVTDSAGHRVAVTKSIAVTPPLVADYAFMPTNPVTGERVVLTANPAGGTPPYSYSWDMGDGSTYDGGTIEHAYASVGTFTVTLTVRDSAEHVASTANSIPVTHPVTANFTFSQARPMAGEMISFSGIVDGGTPPYTLAWAFGDGSRDSGANTTYAYRAAGSFVVTLEASDSASHVASESRTIEVSPLLTPDFGFTPSNPVILEVVSFSANAVGGTSPYTYSWDFGEGGTDAVAVVNHAFTQAGSFPATLRVSDSAGHTVAVAKTISVTPPVAANFTFSPAQPSMGESVSFSPVPSGGTPPYTYRWDFGDGTSSVESQPKHGYSGSGFSSTYTVRLSACDSAGHCASSFKDIPIQNWSLIFTIVGVTLIVSVVAAWAIRRFRLGKT